MNKEELLKNTLKQVEDINKSMNALKYRVSRERDESISKKAETAMQELEFLRDQMQQHYNKLSEAENNNEKLLNEMDKNIYNSITAFKDAFKKAGGIFKTHII